MPTKEPSTKHQASSDVESHREPIEPRGTRRDETLEAEVSGPGLRFGLALCLVRFCINQ